MAFQSVSWRTSTSIGSRLLHRSLRERFQNQQCGVEVGEREWKSTTKHVGNLSVVNSERK